MTNVLSSKLADYSDDELSKVLAAYRADNKLGAVSWRIEEIENEIAARGQQTTIAIQKGFMIVRTPENRLGQVYLISVESEL